MAEAIDAIHEAVLETFIKSPAYLRTFKSIMEFEGTKESSTVSAVKGILVSQRSYALSVFPSVPVSTNAQHKTECKSRKGEIPICQRILVRLQYLPKLPVPTRWFPPFRTDHWHDLVPRADLHGPLTLLQVSHRHLTGLPRSCTLLTGRTYFGGEGLNQIAGASTQETYLAMKVHESDH